MTGDNVGLQVIVPIGSVLTVRAGETTWSTLVMRAYMSGEVCLLRKGAGA